MSTKPRLGRGLDALLSGSDPDGPATVSGSSSEVLLETIEPNPHQPRKSFDEDELSSLRDSIKAHGVLQPLVVRQQGDHFQLIAGERRFRAAQEAGLTSVPVRVINLNDQQVLEAALVENIQRSDLNPIEKAQGFKDYLDRYQMTHEQLGQRLGLARSSITNLVALLDLPVEVQEAIRVGQLSIGHAKLLKTVGDPAQQIDLSKKIISRGLSVHATDALIKSPEGEETHAGGGGRNERVPFAKTTHVQGVEDDLRQRMSTKVEIRLKGKDRGQFVIHFESNDDFERIVESLQR